MDAAGFFVTDAEANTLIEATHVRFEQCTCSPLTCEIRAELDSCTLALHFCLYSIRCSVEFGEMGNSFLLGVCQLANVYGKRFPIRPKFVP